jgi:hypothetical protein
MLRVRTGIACLLMVVVPLCPGFCLDKQVRSSALAPAPSSCGCCESTPPAECPSPADLPQPARNADPDCLCHGAIMGGAKLDGGDDGERLAAPLLDSQGVAHLPIVRDPAIDSQTVRHFPPNVSGRDICALVCLLLI